MERSFKEKIEIPNFKEPVLTTETIYELQPKLGLKNDQRILRDNFSP